VPEVQGKRVVVVVLFTLSFRHLSQQAGELAWA
jgi:hypothetical protein